ncbi:MAG: hypothetical protein LBQ75_01390 [Zoogloeaceae bacterium]|jgi:hypothetical protein|nr:hypothetical protein [Zoogloeaceae bacterium]
MTDNRKTQQQASRNNQVMWTEEEDALLRSEYLKTTITSLAEKMGRSRYAVFERVRALGLPGKQKNVVLPWTEEEIEYLKANYRTTQKRELAQRLNKGMNNLYCKATELELIRKSSTRYQGKVVRCGITLDVESREFAKKLGKGNISDGIRIALKRTAEREKR